MGGCFLTCQFYWVESSAQLLKGVEIDRWLVQWSQSVAEHGELAWEKSVAGSQELLEVQSDPISSVA